MAKVLRRLYGCVGLLITRVFYLGGSGTTFAWTAHRYIDSEQKMPWSLQVALFLAPSFNLCSS